MLDILTRHTSSYTPHDLTCAVPRRSDDPPSGGRRPLGHPGGHRRAEGPKIEVGRSGHQCSCRVQRGPLARERPSSMRRDLTMSPPAAGSKCKHWAAADGPCSTSRPSAHAASRATWLRPSLAHGSGHGSSGRALLAAAVCKRRQPAGTNQISFAWVPSSAIPLQRAALRCVWPSPTWQHDSVCTGWIATRIVALSMAAHPLRRHAHRGWSVQEVAPCACSCGVAAHLPEPAAGLWRVGVVLK